MASSLSKAMFLFVLTEPIDGSRLSCSVNLRKICPRHSRLYVEKDNEDDKEMMMMMMMMKGNNKAKEGKE